MTTTARASTTSIRLRPAEPADDGFFYRLYASTRDEELAAVPWNDAQREAFLRMQFEAQTRHYAEHFAYAARFVLERDGAPAGRLIVAELPGEIRIVDISLLPEHRGAGVGTALLEEQLERARARGLSVGIHVEANNPARRLYERLGFTAEHDVGVHVFMLARPRASAEGRR